MADLRVGISGWTYPKWRGNFYPEGLTQKRELAYASRRFRALEINGTFYSLQRPSTFQTWYDETPPDFLFTLKGGRYLTHMRKLKEPQEPLANFLASGLLRLREKLGPILWQFPPGMMFDEDRFRAFFEILPRDTRELAKFAGKYTSLAKDRIELEVDQSRPLRHAVEFRHDSFLTDRFIELLQKHRIALVIADAASKHPSAEDVTTDWIYVRLHGSRQIYVSGYTEEEIERWAKRVQTWHKGSEPADARRISTRLPPDPHGRDVYVFFDNTDVKLRAPVDARQLAIRLGIDSGQSPEETMQDPGVQPAAGKRRKPASS